MIDRLNGRVAVLLSACVVLIVVLVGWFGFVSPQRSKAASLADQADATRVQVASTEAYLKSPVARQSKAQLKRLSKALPDDVRMSEILRQLSAAAAQAHVSISAITPGTLVPAVGGQAIPVTVAVQGHYFGISSFLHLLRTRASASGKTIHASGRLYAIDGISFTNGSGDTGSVISASLSLNAFVSTPATPTTAVPTTTSP